MQPSAQPPARSATPPLGEVLGSYRIVEAIGSGAMGAVYRGYHLESGAEVAVKVLHERRAAHGVLCERMKREAEAMNAIDHPNIVRVYGFDTSPDGRPFLAMELLRGRTLADVILNEGPLDWRRAAHLIREIALGLAAAHEKGFVHRDLKPGNVMVMAGAEGETVKLLDFGIVGMIDDPRTKLTNDGTVLGTPVYMAPEQIMSSSVDHQADLYALGIILFELLSGRPPFEGCFREIAAKHLLTPPGPLPDCGSLEILVHRLLAKDARDRPASAMEVVAEIDDTIRPTHHSLPAQRVPLCLDAPALPEAHAFAEPPPTRGYSEIVLAPPASRTRWWAIGGATLALAATVAVVAAVVHAPFARATDRGVVAVEPLIVVEPLRAAVEPPRPEMVSALPAAPAQAAVVPAAAAPAPIAAAAPVAPREAPVVSRAVRRAEPEVSYGLVNDRLRTVSKQLSYLAGKHSAHTLDRFEEEYLDLSASLEPGRDPDHYRRLVARIDALERGLRTVR